MPLVARRKEHFQGFWAIFLVAQLSPKRGILVNKNSLASCRRCRHSVEPRALTCPFKVDTPHINTFEGDSVLSKLVVCSPPSRSRRPRLGLCQRKRFSQKRFRSRFRGVHEHPAVQQLKDGSNEGNSSHWIVLFYQRYWLAGVSGRGSGRRALSGQDSPTCGLGAHAERAVWRVKIGML